MHVHVTQQQSHLPILSESVTLLVEDFLQFHQMEYEEAHIHFVETKHICELHAHYFNDPSPTDCITFPMDEPGEPDALDYRIMGDIFICPETASSYVAGNGGDVYQETTLYLVHGLLHILGYRDLEEHEIEEMREAESAYLAHVDAKQLWLRA